MIIESAAGEFDFNIEALQVKGEHVVLIGKMGVWEAETSMDRNDMWKLLGLTLGSLSFWLYAIKLPFYAIFGPKKSDKGVTND
jgi:hypothetical protein